MFENISLTYTRNRYSLLQVASSYSNGLRETAPSTKCLSHSMKVTVVHRYLLYNPAFLCQQVWYDVRLHKLKKYSHSFELSSDLDCSDHTVGC